MHCSEAFHLVKSICDRVIKQPSKQDLEELMIIFSKIDGKTLSQLQDYILYPLELNLQRPDIRLEIKRYNLECIRNLFDYTEIKDIKRFFHLFTLIFIQLFDKSSNNMIADVSEELKLSVVCCARQITVKCTDDIVTQIYEKDNIPRISQGIFICMQIMQNEKLKSLRVAAIEFIMAISRTDDLRREVDAWRPNVADTLMFIVPGILSGLHKVVVGDEKQGHIVTMMALRAWCRILVLVLEDIAMPDMLDGKVHFSAKVTERMIKSEMKHGIFDKSKKGDTHSVLKAIQNQFRSTEWVDNVTENIMKMAESFRVLQQHTHLKVRLELVKTCSSVLCNCLQQIGKVSVVFIEILLNLCDDDSDEVSSASERSLKEITKILEEQSGLLLYEVLEENYLIVINKLPRIFNVESDNDKLSVLRLLKQYLTLLGSEHLPRLMQSSSNLHRTVQALLQIVELQSSSLSLLEDCSLKDLELNQSAIYQTPWVQFKHFADKNIEEKLKEVLRVLGQIGDLEILSNHCLDLLGTESDQRNEIVFLLNELLLGGCDSEMYEHLVKNTLDVYLSTGMWNVPLSVSTSNKINSNSGNFVSAGQARGNLQLTCLLVDGIGKVATALGKRFCVFLMRCLYPVVERAGSSHEALSAAGMKTAAAIAKATNQGNNITSLLAANMDYFMIQVSLRMRNLRNDPSVLGVLIVAMQHSNQQMLPHLQNAVSDVLLQSCDEFQIHHTSSFLHVFYVFFVCINKWFPSKSRKKKIDDSSDLSCNTSIVESFRKYLENSKTSREENMDASEETVHVNLSETHKSEEEKYELDYNSENLEEELSSKKPRIPSHITMTESIVKRCLHLLPGKDKQCQLQAVEALTEGLLILADYEDQLLPMVHQVWSPLVGRLQDNADPLLLNRSFSLLCVLAHLARDFIRARTLKDVWVPLCKFLTDSAGKSKNKDSGSAFRYTQLFKLQLCLLEGLGGLATHLQLQEKHIYDVLSASVSYLSGCQPKPLQESCVKLFQTIAVYDGDAVWLEMMKMENQMKNSLRDNREYGKNVAIIIEFLSKSMLKSEEP